MHEPERLPVRKIAQFIAGLTIAAIVIHLGMWGLFEMLEARAERNDPPPDPLAVAGEPPRRPPEPRLDKSPPQSLKVVREREAIALDTYGWVDRDAGIVRIPVARAMELLLEKGLPATATGGADGKR